jgi:hypothetical protein
LSFHIVIFKDAYQKKLKLKIKSYSLLAEARPDQAHRRFLCRGWSQHIVDCWHDVVSPGSSPFVSEILISFLAIFPLIYYTAVLTAALMCQVLKHLALFSSH